MGTATRMQLKETETDEQEVGVPAGAGAEREGAVCAQLQTQLLHATQELLRPMQVQTHAILPTAPLDVRS